MKADNNDKKKLNEIKSKEIKKSIQNQRLLL